MPITSICSSDDHKLMFISSGTKITVFTWSEGSCTRFTSFGSIQLDFELNNLLCSGNLLVISSDYFCEIGRFSIQNNEFIFEDQETIQVENQILKILVVENKILILLRTYIEIVDISSDKRTNWFFVRELTDLSIGLTIE